MITLEAVVVHFGSIVYSGWRSSRRAFGFVEFVALVSWSLEFNMTLVNFVRKNAFRNKRRSILTVLSIGGSLLLLTFLITIWRSFYDSKPTEQSAQRLIVRNKVSLVFNLPSAYRQKIQSIPGVKEVVNEQWFGGQYKDDKPANYFAQFGTDPQEIFNVYSEFKIPADQLAAWQHDRAGAVVDAGLAKKFGWKIGDRLNITGKIFPVNLELTIRGIFAPPDPTQSIYFNKDYIDEGFPRLKGSDGFFAVLADSPESVPKVAQAIDEQFRNADRATKTESEHAFQLGFIGMLGNIKAFIMSICLAVVFTILLVSANTMAMSIRERTREVAVLKTLGFTRNSILGLFIGEAVSLSLIGGLMGSLLCFFIVTGMASQGGYFTGMKVTALTIAASLLVAAVVGFVSSFVPSYHAAKVNIVDGLRHIG
jgi:putative ABC transport system permease protein